jgi:hypothetical protein
MRIIAASPRSPWIEREIAAILDAEPGKGFTVGELCQRIYNDLPVRKPQRVAVLRAARSLARRRPSLSCYRALDRGELVWGLSIGGEIALDTIDRELLGRISRTER